GFRYRDPAGTAGGVTLVQLDPTHLKIKLKGSNAALFPGPVQALDAALTIGDVGYCGRFTNFVRNGTDAIVGTWPWTTAPGAPRPVPNTPTAPAMATGTPTAPPTATPRPSNTPTVPPSATPSASATHTSTATPKPSPTWTATVRPSNTATSSPTATRTASAT